MARREPGKGKLELQWTAVDPRRGTGTRLLHEELKDPEATLTQRSDRKTQERNTGSRAPCRDMDLNFAHLVT